MEKLGSPLHHVNRPAIPNFGDAIKKALVVMLASLVVGTVCFALYFHYATRPARLIACAPDAEMQWLKKEYALNETQFARIQALHSAYSSKCGVMCSEIIKANSKLETLLHSSQGIVTPKIGSAMAGVNAADLHCRQNMLEHIYAVSREMSPSNGERYRRMMEAQVLQRDMRHGNLAPPSN